MNLTRLLDAQHAVMSRYMTCNILHWKKYDKDRALKGDHNLSGAAGRAKDAERATQIRHKRKSGWAAFNDYALICLCRSPTRVSAASHYEAASVATTQGPA